MSHKSSKQQVAVKPSLPHSTSSCASCCTTSKQGNCQPFGSPCLKTWQTNNCRVNYSRSRNAAKTLAEASFAPLPTITFCPIPSR